MKKWYLSKTVWVNLLALIGIALETVTGKQILDPDTQGVILTIINLILRFLTKQGVTFKDVIDVIKPDAAAAETPQASPKAVDAAIVLPTAETPTATPAAAPQTAAAPGVATTEQVNKPVN